MIKRGRACPPCKVFDRAQRQKFLKYIAEGWSEEYARKRCRISHGRYQRYKKETPEWNADLDEAVERGILALEDEAHRRAYKGVLNPVVGNGRIVTHKREFSDGLMKMALSARSKKYAAHSATGTNLEIAMSGAAQVLLDRLSALVEHTNQVERNLLNGEIEGSPTTRGRKKEGA